MEPTSAVRTEALPAIATVIAPGALLTTPYIAAAMRHADKTKEFLDKHEAIAVSVAILVWVIGGFLVESIGSYVEYYCIDARRSDRDKMLATWWQFLRIAWPVEPIGQRYLRRMLVSFKFELNMCVATGLCTLGVAPVFHDHLGWGWT